MDVAVHAKARDDDGIGLMERILSAIGAGKKFSSAMVGWLSKEAPKGASLKKRAAELLNDLGFKLVDASTNLLEVFAMKAELEIQNIRKATFLCASVLKNYVVPKLEVVIDKEKVITHVEPLAH